MSCPLIGQIAVTLDPGMHAQNLKAVLVQHRNHEVLLLRPQPDLWETIQLILQLVPEPERHRMVRGIDCACSDSAEGAPVVLRSISA